MTGLPILNPHLKLTLWFFLFGLIFSVSGNCKSIENSGCSELKKEESLSEAIQRLKAAGNCHGLNCETEAVSTLVVPHEVPHIKSAAGRGFRSFKGIEEELWQFTREGMKDHQTDLMKTFKLNSQEYLELSKAAWGVLYVESKHFESPWYYAKSSPLGATIPWLKRANCIKAGTSYEDCDTNMSHGPTQIKRVPDEIRLAPYGISEEDLWKSPPKAAVATIAILAKNLSFARAISKKFPRSPCAKDHLACAVFAYNHGTRKIVLNQLADADLEKGYVKVVKEQMSLAKANVCVTSLPDLLEPENPSLENEGPTDVESVPAS